MSGENEAEHLQELHLTNFDEETTDIFREEFTKYFAQTEEQEDGGASNGAEQNDSSDVPDEKDWHDPSAELVDDKHDSSVEAKIDERSDAPDEKDIIDPSKELAENINPKEESKCDLDLVKTHSTGSNTIKTKFSEMNFGPKPKQAKIEDFFKKNEL